MRRFAMLVSFAACGTAPAVPDGGASADATDDGGPDATAELPLCSCYYGAGKYCGSGVEAHAASAGCTVPSLAANDLYNCSGTTTAPGTWSVAQACTNGCTIAPPHYDDSCTNPNAYYLPWASGVAHTCTQGHNQGSHTGTGVYAWDFGMPDFTPIWAARAGT